MITWMQKHKKWLVVTIWISTIAFVGAGFVGWGSYDYGKTSGAVAVVGDREITVEEYQREYSSLYSQYAQMFGEQFNQEMAKTLNLSEAAVKLAIQKNLILSYADSLGLDATNDEVVKELLTMPSFIKAGKFDKETYIRVLGQNRTTPLIFEKAIKRNLILQKVEKLFKLQASNVEIEMLSSLMFLEDDISIEVLSSKDVNLVVDEKKLKDYWLLNKFDYMSSTAYDVSINKIALANNNYSEAELNKAYFDTKYDYKKEDGKLKSFDEAKAEVITYLNVKATKNIALKEYLKIKKGTSSFKQTMSFYENKLNYSQENIRKIIEAKEGTILKPFLDKNEYITIKINKKTPPKPLSFHIAKKRVTEAYSQIEIKNLLALKADEKLKSFKGERIGYVSRSDISKIKALSQNEAAQFLGKLFTVSTKIGKIQLDSKVVLYKINDSKLVNVDASKKAAVKDSISSILDEELMNNLVKELEKTYEVKSSLLTQTKE